MALTKKEKAEFCKHIREIFDSGDSLRFHIQHYASGMGCKVRVWHPDGHILFSVGGCGFDREGTALGEIFEMVFSDKLQTLPLPVRNKHGNYEWEQLYGLSEYKGTNDSRATKHVDGACGWSSMEKIGKAMGLEIERHSACKRSTIVFIRHLDRFAQKG